MKTLTRTQVGCKIELSQARFRGKIWTRERKVLFMKKLLALVCALVLSLSMTAVLAEETDAFTSASVASYYADFALTGDELMNAINSFSGTYLICTTNPDGTANAGVFIFACVKNEDKYYIQMGLAENQTKQNLLRTGEALAVYAANPSTEEGAKPYITAGARMVLQQVTDEELLKVLNVKGSETALFFEITEIKPLG